MKLWTLVRHLMLVLITFSMIMNSVWHWLNGFVNAYIYLVVLFARSFRLLLGVLIYLVCYELFVLVDGDLLGGLKGSSNGWVVFNFYTSWFVVNQPLSAIYLTLSFFELSSSQSNKPFGTFQTPTRMGSFAIEPWPRSRLSATRVPTGSSSKPS